MLGFIGRLLGLDTYRDKTVSVVLSAQDTVYKGLLVFLTFTALIWMSIFFYAAFYYSYLPAVSHVRPVHLQFRVCGKGGSQELCSYPSANITLTHKEQLLAVGQPYKIGLELEVPESPANQELGMFMVCGHLKNKEGDVISKSCRSALITYKSPLLKMISTLIFAPFLVTGSSEERQKMEIELFSNFQEQRNSPATDAYIQIQNQKIEIYRSSLKIVAHFTGLRYIMFHWPFLSAVVGILVNLFFLTIIAFLSWQKYFIPAQAVYQVPGYDGLKAKSIEEQRSQPRVEKVKPLRSQQKQEQKAKAKAELERKLTKDDLEQDSTPPPEPSTDDNDDTNSERIDAESTTTSQTGVDLKNSSDEFEKVKKKEEEGASGSEDTENVSESEEDKENRPSETPSESEESTLRHRNVRD